MAWRAASSARTSRRLVNNASSDTISALARFSTKAAKVVSKSASTLAGKINTSCPSLRAASFNSRVADRCARLVGFTRRAMSGVVGSSSRRSSILFGYRVLVMTLTPVRLPPGRLKLATSPVSTGSLPVAKRDYCRRHPQATGCDIRCAGEKHGHFPLDEFGYHRRQPIKLAVGPAELEGDILALGETVFSQAPAEAFHQIGVGARRPPTHEPDYRHRRLLRARRERPRHCRPAEQPHEVASFHY